MQLDDRGAAPKAKTRYSCANEQQSFLMQIEQRLMEHLVVDHSPPPPGAEG